MLLVFWIHYCSDTKEKPFSKRRIINNELFLACNMFFNESLKRRSSQLVFRKINILEIHLYFWIFLSTSLSSLVLFLNRFSLKINFLLFTHWFFPNNFLVWIRLFLIRKCTSECKIEAIGIDTEEKTSLSPISGLSLIKHWTEESHGKDAATCWIFSWILIPFSY